MRAAQDLQEEAEERMRQQERRLQEYRRMTAPYFGDFDRRGSRNIQANYADGRAALRWMGMGSEAEEAPQDVLNMIPEIVDSIVAVRGVQPSHTVRPEDGSAQAVAQAVKRTRALREQHAHSGMVTQGAQLAFFLVAMGDAAMVMNPRVPDDIALDKRRLGREDPFRPPGVYLTVVNPSNAFPRFRFGYSVNDLEDLFCVWKLSAQEAKTLYGIKVDDDTQVVHYYGQSEKRIIVAGRDVIEPVEHELGFCPAVWCHNKASDGRSAQSDIRMAITMNRQLGLVYDIWVDSLIWAIHPIIHVHDREYVDTPSGAPEVGPGATISTTQSGTVELIAPAGRPEVAGQMMEVLVQSLHQVTGVSPIQTQGVIDHSNVSARSVDRQMSPMETRLQLSNTLLAESYQLLNAKVLLMLSHLPAFQKVQFPLYGQDQEGTYSDSFTSDDLGGWIRTKTTWDASLGTSKHELLAMVLQVYKESLVTPQPYRYPFRKVLEALGIEDPDMVMKEAAAEHQASLALLKASEEAMPPPPGGAGPHGHKGGGGGAPGEPPEALQAASALQQGGLKGAGPPGEAGPVQPPVEGPAVGPGLSQPAPLPNFAPVAAAPNRRGMGTPAPVPDIGQLVTQAIQHLRLYGEVYYQGGPHHSIEITVTDHRDVAQVRQAVQNVAGSLTVNVKVRKPSTSASNGRVH